MNDYRFKGKDPVIDILRTLVQARATIESKKFSKVLHDIERETNGGVKYSTLYGWFSGPTLYPQHRFVTRVILCLQRYARKPVQYGDREVRAMPGIVRQRKAG